MTNQKRVASKKQASQGYVAPKPTMDEILGSREQVAKASAQFLKVDLDTAKTFLQIARQTDNPARKERNRRAARKAYDTMVRFMERVKLKDEDLRILVPGLEQLRSELEGIGETF